MTETMVAHEYYCSAYASKDQPHIEGLLHTLSDSLRYLKVKIAQKLDAGESVESLERAKIVLNSLVQGNNRRMHKGFTEMISYLLCKPSYYCSHNFTTLIFGAALTARVQIVKKFIDTRKIDSLFNLSGRKVGDAVGDVLPVPGKSRVRRYITNDDYLFRPEELERFPLYFFSAACCPVLGEGSASLQWYVYSDPSNGSLKRHPNYMQGKRVMSLRMPGIPLQDPTTGEELYYYPYNIGLRTSTAWLIPNLLGRLPSKPDVKHSTCVDKGSYALFIMLLF